jgi:predicted O-methyltransferase YrrM
MRSLNPVRIAKRLWSRAVYATRLKAAEGIHGWLSPHEAVGLYHTARKLPRNALVVEIGCWKGKSTYCIARGLAEGRVVVIDPFDSAGEPGSADLYRATQGDRPLLEQFRENMQRLGVAGKIDTWPGYSHAFAGRLTGIDFLFIDGDHSVEGCDGDFRNYAPAVKRGGFIAFHDYDPGRTDLGPTWVIQNRILPSAEWRQVAIVDMLWVGRRL